MKKLRFSEGEDLKSIFDPYSTGLDPAWNCDNVLGGGKKRYTSKSPASGRPSISAAAALNICWEFHDLRQAERAVQSCILQQHSLSHNKEDGNYYLIMLASTYAARAWRSQAVGGFFVIDPSKKWEWVMVRNLRAWEFIPSVWDVSSHDVHMFGFLALRQTSQPVPALAAALTHLQPRAPRMPDAIRANLCDLEGIAAGTLRTRELSLLQHALKDCPADMVNRLLTRLKEEHAKLEAAALARAEKKAGQRNTGESPWPA